MPILKWFNLFFRPLKLYILQSHRKPITYSRILYTVSIVDVSQMQIIHFTCKIEPVICLLIKNSYLIQFNCKYDSDLTWFDMERYT